MEDPARTLDGRTIQLSNTAKVLFPDDGITKGEVIDHYERLAEPILRAVAGRPLTLRRFPDGIAAAGWFQKQAGDHFPEWIRRVSLPRRDGGEVDHVVAEEPATLVYLADQAAIELHAALATADHLDAPEEIVFDLDPMQRNDVDGVRRATTWCGELLAELGLDTRLKTSGSAGYHVHVALDGSVDQSVARDFARDVATVLVARHPRALTVAYRKAARGNRVFVDWVRNSLGQTVVVPYGLRARAGAPVAAPIDWDELARTDPRRWTLRNVNRRLAQRDDPWVDPPKRSDLVAAREALTATLDEVD